MMPSSYTVWCSRSQISLGVTFSYFEIICIYEGNRCAVWAQNSQIEGLERKSNGMAGVSRSVLTEVIFDKQMTSFIKYKKGYFYFLKIIFLHIKNEIRKTCLISKI